MDDLEEAVEPQADTMTDMVDQALEDSHTDAVEKEPVEKPEKKMVPLHELQKLREKKKELELELQWERQRNAQQAQPQKPVEDDSSRYESATREDLSRSQEEIIRVVEEKRWVKEHPEKYERINEYLPTFLKQRPNLAAAIAQAPNRYEEAYTLMEALTPRQQAQLKKDVVAQPKKEAPNAPGSVPKGAMLNETTDVMSMTDAEFSAWRKSKQRRR